MMQNLFIKFSAVEEQEIAVVASEDPLPFTVAHSIKTIFYTIARKRKLNPEHFFRPLQQKENNDKLVKVSISIV